MAKRGKKKQPGRPLHRRVSRTAPLAGPRRREKIIDWPPISTGMESTALALLFQLEQSQWWPENKLLAHQLRQLQALIDHAARTVPFYRDRLVPVHGLPPGALTAAALGQVPVLGRAAVLEAGNELISRVLPPSHGRTFDLVSSGSTGHPVRAKGTRVTGLFVNVLGMRYHLWHKRDLSAKNMTIRSIKEGKKAITKTTWGIRGYMVGPSCHYDISLPIDDLFDGLLKEKPAYVQTHPYTLMEMIRRSRQLGIKPDGLREVRTVGEILDSQVRQACEKEWGASVVDMYSTTEQGTIALQCPDHLHYHVQSESVLVEALDDDGSPCPPGRMGRLVVTLLNNYATPLIRYETGDYGELGPPCPCGRGLPVIKRIIGRIRNLVVLPGGEKISPVFKDDLLLAIAPLRQYQLTQKTRQEIEVTLAVERPLTEDEENGLGDYFTEHFRHAFDYRFIYVDEIPRSTAGKFEIFRTEIANP